jgi:hypothetical protein
MHPIDIAHTLAQQRVNARGEHDGPSPLYDQDPWKIAPLTAAIPTSAPASAMVRGDPVPTSSIIPPEAAAIKKRRWRSAWARALQNHPSPTGDARPGA